MNDANPPAAELGITTKDMGIQSAPEGIEKLFGQSFKIKRLENGKPIPVGGDSIFTDKLAKEVIGDFDYFNGLFGEMHSAVEIYNSDSLKKWLEAQQLSIDPGLVAKLTAFTKKLEERYPIAPVNTTTRKDMYAQSERVKLSDIFENQNAECAEIAALAQYFLQSEGVNSTYFSGEVLWNKEDEFGEKHTFITIKDQGKQYLYDPANPTKAQDGLYPSLYTIRADFDAEMKKGQKRFVTGTNILTKQKTYYGAGDGTNVSPTDIEESPLNTALASEGNEKEMGTDLDVIIKKKILYHGSATSGINNLNPAEEDTVGSGVYFTSEEKDAIGYANRRAKNRGGKPVVYKAEVENLRLANLTTDENVRKILKEYKLILQQKMKDTDKWYVQDALKKSIEIIDKEKVGIESVKEVTFSNTGFFTEYLSSLGYDGLIALEGGEGDEIGNHDSYVIFDPNKVKIVQEQKVVK